MLIWGYFWGLFKFLWQHETLQGIGNQTSQACNCKWFRDWSFAVRTFDWRRGLAKKKHEEGRDKWHYECSNVSTTSIQLYLCIYGRESPINHGPIFILRNGLVSHWRCNQSLSINGRQRSNYVCSVRTICTQTERNSLKTSPVRHWSLDWLDDLVLLHVWSSCICKRHPTGSGGNIPNGYNCTCPLPRLLVQQQARVPVGQQVWQSGIFLMDRAKTALTFLTYHPSYLISLLS